jgi:hippurate hydrolase
MPVVNRIAELSSDAGEWRRHLHQNPELLYEVHETAAFVAEKLRAFGCDDVVTGIGRTGVVGLIKGRQGDGPTIGLRADMDALPICEESGAPHASRKAGLMHACGHDGHTATLLAAARYLAETRNFPGVAAVIFQPAEEGGAGGKAMVDDGLMERFAIKQVFGLHNAPGLPVGCFATRVGALLAATDTFEIIVKGRGGHAAKPHECIDPVVVAAQIVVNLQSVAARVVDPLDSLVISVPVFNAGAAVNVIPEQVTLGGTIRSLKPETRKLARAKLFAIAEGVAAAHGASATIDFREGYPMCVNHAAETALAVKVAREVAGEAAVLDNIPPFMGGEDFAYMLEARPGAFLFFGNGPSAGLHHPAYDFNDGAIAHGASFFARLVETATRLS